MAEGALIKRLLTIWSEGGSASVEALAPEVYHELTRLARNHLRGRSRNQELQRTALVNEAWVHLLAQSQPSRCEIRAHLLGIAARLARFILVDYARAHSAGKLGYGTADL